jgi:hypothetical protein
LRRHPQHSERGQVLPIFTFGLAAILGLSALGVDMGCWSYQQRLAQSAADSAAIAAAIELEYSSVSANVASAARTDSASNGFTNNVSGVTVTVHQPPSSGAYTSNTSAVEVIVQKTAPSYFAKFFGISSQLISARAVAVQNPGARGCIYALKPNATDVTVNGSTVNIATCSIVSNGNTLINGSTVTAGSISYVGTSTVNGSTVNVTPQKSIAASDPCHTIPGCESIATVPPLDITPQSTSTYNGCRNATIPPGTYAATLIINGCNGVTFSSGTYILDNGMTINGSSNVSGSNVTFYIKGGGITLNGSNFGFTAPTTGSTAGVLFYQLSSDTNGFTYNGSGGTGLAGMMYFPNSAVTLNGSISSWLMTVGNTVTINGSGMNVSSSAFPVGGHVVLGE